MNAAKRWWTSPFVSWDRDTGRFTFNPLGVLLYIAVVAVAVGVTVGVVVRLWEWAL